MPDARGTEYLNSVLVGTEFENDHECGAMDTYQFVLEFAARSFQTLFIMDKSSKMLCTRDYFKNFQKKFLEKKVEKKIVHLFYSNFFNFI